MRSDRNRSASSSSSVTTMPPSPVVTSLFAKKLNVESSPKRAGAAPLAADAALRTVRLGGVLDDCQPVLGRERKERLHLDGWPELSPAGRRVRGVTRSAAARMSIVQVPGSESTSTGVAPVRTTASAQEMIVKVGMITSSPGPRSSASTAICSAAVPLHTDARDAGRSIPPRPARTRRRTACG